MKGRILIALLISSQTVLIAQTPSAPAKHEDKDEEARKVYNAYPPGILPSDLNSEIARVLGEVDFIEARGIARWQALTPPILTGQPPILQNTGTEAVETLGELRRAYELRQKHLAQQKYSLRVLPHAVRRL